LSLIEANWIKVHDVRLIAGSARELQALVTEGSSRDLLITGLK